MTRYTSVYLLVLAIYSVCFIGAAFNHTRDILANGFLVHSGRPISTHFFWTSLTFVDPLVPLLILARRVKPAILLASAIMLADVAVNTHYAYNHRETVYYGNLDLVAQTAFFGFVLCTAPLLWKYSDNHAVNQSGEVDRS
ncbi:MAG: hypothetical protein R3C59_15350 [Planctomycetaceae bacterium]